MAKKKFFLKSTKVSGLRFDIVSLDKEKMRATLLGNTGAPFEQSISEENLKKFGFEVMSENVEPVHSEQD
jgi:hypothetical protein